MLLVWQEKSANGSGTACAGVFRSAHQSHVSAVVLDVCLKTSMMMGQSMRMGSDSLVEAAMPLQIIR